MPRRAAIRPVRVLWALAAAAAAVVLPACGERYDQSTPEAVIASAHRMVEEGRADRLTDLIYAETPEMREMLRGVGHLLGSLQDLATEVRAAFPEEVEKLRRDAEAAAKRSAATGMLNSVRGRRQSGRANEEDRRRAFDNAIRGIFADPYAWLDANAGRLSVQPMSDDLAAVLLDGQPILPPIGVVLRLDGDKWYVVLPTTAPGISRIMPRTPEAYEILGSLGKVFDSMLAELAEEVRQRKFKSLDDLARAAGEKAFVPAALVFIAYERAMDEARKAERQARQPG